MNDNRGELPGISRRTFLRTVAGVSAGFVTGKNLDLNKLLQSPSGEEISPSQINPKLADAGFYLTNYLGGKILTLQHDLSQYSPPVTDKDNKVRNACGFAVVANAVKTFTFLRDGVVPDLKLQQVIDFAQKETVENRPMVDWNSSVTLLALQCLLEKYSKIYSDLYSVLPLTTIYGHNGGTIPALSYTDILNVVTESRNQVFNRGGLVVGFGHKYNYGHFALFSDFANLKNGDFNSFVIDARGYDLTGIVAWVKLNEYFGESTNKQTALMGGALGLVPNF